MCGRTSTIWMKLAFSSGLGHLLSNCDLRLGLHLFLMLTLANHFQFQADNSLAIKQLEGHKQNKERLTLALCCNGNGSDKLPLWVIEKYKNPRYFKSVNLGSLGCTYQSNAKAWMTQIIFLEWLNAFDLHVANRKVLLVLDNCSAHVPLEELPTRIQLRNTCVYFLLQRLEDDVDQVEKIDML